MNWKNGLTWQWNLRTATPAVDPPIVLQNHPFSAPVEGVLESFGLPGRGEVDPCSVMSIFYYVLFGLMLSDAAYGLWWSLGAGWHY